MAASPCNPTNPATSGYQFSWFDWFCLWYPPGWLILFNRHWQHYRPDPDGWNWLEYLLFLLPAGFYLALLLRWLRLGCRSPRPSSPPAADPSYQRQFQREILTPIVQHYFRAELSASTTLPANGPLIVMMNHAGMCFPWDFLSLGLLLSQQHNWFVQPLAHPLFFDHPWLTWWLPAGWAQTLGGVRAERESFAAAVADQTVVLYAPEGWRGLIKGWSQRYQLAAFDPSFLRLSHRYQVPVLPALCLGSENLHPWAINVTWLAHRVNLPLMPLSPLMPIFLLFPSMGVWAARTRLRYYLQPLSHPRPESSNQTALYQQAQSLRLQMQTQLEQLLAAEQPRRSLKQG